MTHGFLFKNPIQAAQIVESRITEQRVIEDDSSGLYTAVREKLPLLYKLGFW